MSIWFRRERQAPSCIKILSRLFHFLIIIIEKFARRRKLIGFFKCLTNERHFPRLSFQFGTGLIIRLIRLFFQLKFTYLLLTGTRSILYVESHTVTIGACVFLRFSCSWRTNVSSGRKRGGAGRWNAQIDMFGCCCCCCHALLSVEAKKRKERREASGVKPVRTWMFITEGERTWTTTSLHSLTSR